MMFLQGFVSSAHLDSKALSLIKFFFGPCKRRRRPSKVYALSMSHMSDRNWRPEGGEWEPIKISSEIDPSAYIPKSPQALEPRVRE